MNLKEYIKNLSKLLEEHPEAAEFEVVTACDDEGNGFNRVYYTPSIGCYDADDKEFQSIASMLEDLADGERDEISESNAVCVN